MNNEEIQTVTPEEIQPVTSATVVSKKSESKKLSTSKVEVAKIEFDEWWAERSKLISNIHRKEILKADFKGRGLSNLETMEAFDKALQKYGVKLK